MYVTCSRKSNVFVKSFTKKLSLILPNVKYIPRGQTNISDLFKNSLYLGHKYFLKTTNTRNKKTILLQQYDLKNKEFFLSKKYLITPISTDLKISVISLKSQKDINKPKEIFCFLNYFYEVDSLLVLNKEKNVVSFTYNQKEIGFSFKLEEIE
jgi:hypothetical protein